MEAKMQDDDLSGDIAALIRPIEKYDQAVAFELVRAALLEKIDETRLEREPPKKKSMSTFLPLTPAGCIIGSPVAAPDVPFTPWGCIVGVKIIIGKTSSPTPHPILYARPGGHA
jgi:hypothetical protein